MRSWHRLALILTLTVCTLGCGARYSTAPASIGTPSPTAASALPTTALKYHVIDVAGEPRLDCGPPLVSSAYETQQLAAARTAIAEVASDQQTLSAVQSRLHITPHASSFTDVEAREIYQELLKLRKIQLAPAGSAFRFSYAALVDSATTRQVDGSVSSAGGVTVERTGPSQFVSCPICLVRGTLIDTPSGPLAVELVRAGMAVYTADADGKRVAVSVLRVGSSLAPANHMVLTIDLSDGRSVTASPNHPTADGRPLSSLRVSDRLDGAVITSIAEQAYDGGRTYDLLPAGPTAAYWADGVLLGSTLMR